MVLKNNIIVCDRDVTYVFRYRYLYIYIIIKLIRNVVDYMGPSMMLTFMVQ